MKSLCNIPSGVFRNFWKLILKQNSMLDKIRTFICVRVGYKKSFPPNHHLIYLASPVMPKRDLRNRFFYPTHTLMVRFQNFFLHFQLNLVTFFPIFLKKNPNLPKKKKIFFFFLKIAIFIQSPHTHKLHDDNLLPLHLISPSIF